MNQHIHQGAGIVDTLPCGEHARGRILPLKRCVVGKVVVDVGVRIHSAAFRAASLQLVEVEPHGPAAVQEPSEIPRLGRGGAGFFERAGERGGAEDEGAPQAPSHHTHPL